MKSREISSRPENFSQATLQTTKNCPWDGEREANLSKPPFKQFFQNRKENHHDHLLQPHPHDRCTHPPPLDTNLSAEAKLTGALLYTFEDGGLSAQELVNVLSLPPEKVAPVFAELTGNGYLEILEENGAFGLHLKG